ncbi:uncharacterized protein RB166_020971, partial [Leptodactylus fuscus]|uniref:uncharacterized protein LOC142186466 n=1 Tax=Leptodactylus fuscus TaxID=238119 RepID=UPI003F4F36AE
VCVKYLHDECDLGKDCTRLHVCGYFSRGECNRRFCKFSHHILEFSSDLFLRCRIPEVSVQNFQMLCTVKHNERLQSVMNNEKGNPAAQQRRGRRGGRNRNKRGSQDASKSQSRGRQQERSGSNFRGRSSSRPMSKSGESDGDDEDYGDEPQKSKLDQVMEDWFSSSPAKSGDKGASVLDVAARTSQVFQPMTTPSAHHPTPTVTTSNVVIFYRSDIQPIHLKASVSSAHPGGLLASSSSVPQPKSSTTPVATASLVNVPSTTPGPSRPVTLPMKGPSVANSTKPVMNPSTVPPEPPTRPKRFIDSSTNEVAASSPSPYSAQPVATIKPVTSPSPSGTSSTSSSRLDEKPVTASVTSSSNVQPVSIIKPVVTSQTSPSGAPTTSYSRLLDYQSSTQEKPVVTPIVSPSRSQPVATSPASPSGAPTTSYSRLLDHPPSTQKKPVVTPIVSPSRTQPVATITPVATSPASPSSAPSPSYTRLVDSPTKGPCDPVQRSVHVQSILDHYMRPTYSNHLVDRTSTQEATYVSPKKTEPNKVPEICVSNVWKYCKLGNRCPYMHYYLPYRWQIYKGTDWEDVSDMEEIEKSYCDPKVDRVPLVDFLTMRSGNHRVRRLSTVSSVTKPCDYVLTTEWLWYWKDEYGAWTQYGHSNVKQVSAVILCADIENVYLSDPTNVMPFTAGNQKYEINFREMKQRNIVYMTEKPVRRRPKYLSFEDVKLLRGSTKSAAAQSPLKSGSSPLKPDIYPSTWDTQAMPEIGCQKVPVPKTSSEFSEIVNNFTKTVSGHVVKKMWRLQNSSLWQVYQWQKEQMRKVSPGREVKEIRLFHGTEKTHIDAICNQNFDWRICGIHGTVYGQGSYFARDASYSHNYSTPTLGGTRTMFVARVLVGDYITGNPHMKRPPLRPGSSTRYYDSCVDNAANPSIFVVFEKHQIYPEYLLEYEEEAKKSCVIC